MPLALKELYEKEKETGQKSMFDWDNLLVAPSELLTVGFQKLYIDH